MHRSLVGFQYYSWVKWYTLRLHWKYKLWLDHTHLWIPFKVVLHDVPDYDERHKLLEGLKNKLEALLSPKLVSAFNSHSLGIVWEILINLLNVLTQHQLYFSCRRKSRILSNISWYRQAWSATKLLHTLSQGEHILIVAMMLETSNIS
jgi:hypothetical protein